MPRKMDPFYDSSGTLEPYSQSPREMVAGGLRGLFNEQKTNDLMTLVNMSGAGTLMDMYEAGRDLGGGNRLAGLTSIAMALVPGSRLMHGSPVKGLSRLERSERGPLGPGVYTSPAPQVANAYTRGEGEIYAMPDREYDIYTGAGHRSDDQWFGFKNDQNRLNQAADTLPTEKAQAIKDVISRMWSGDGYPLYQRVKGILGGDEQAQQFFRSAGFEGISGLVDGPETLLFDPQQLK